MDLRGKVTLVTGGGRGIGRATALALAGAGIHLVSLRMPDPEWPDIRSFAEMRWDTAGEKREWAVNEIAKAIKACRLCPCLNVPGETESAPGYGNVRSPVVIVGQSLCEPCMTSQIPFTGGAGQLLDDAFALARVAKSDVFTTNVVHCHPPNNRPSLPHEIKNCTEYLYRELQVVRPRVVVSLGKDAATVLERWSNTQIDKWTIATHANDVQDRCVLNLPHPSWIRRRPAADRQAFVQTLADTISRAHTLNASN